jgi:hypothetical protein
LDANPLQSDSLASSSTNIVVGDEKCCNIKTFQNAVLCKTKHVDHLLNSLQRYDATVKTKRQLQLELPAGFRQTSTQNKDLNSYL